MPALLVKAQPLKGAVQVATGCVAIAALTRALLEVSAAAETAECDAHTYLHECDFCGFFHYPSGEVSKHRSLVFMFRRARYLAGSMSNQSSIQSKQRRTENSVALSDLVLISEYLSLTTEKIESLVNHWAAALTKVQNMLYHTPCAIRAAKAHRK